MYLDEHNDASVPPVLLRVDFPKGQNSPPPHVTVKAQDRTVAIATHAIDIILQTLEEIHTPEEKQFRRSRSKKFVPIDADLHNIQLSLEVTWMDSIVSLLSVDSRCFTKWPLLKQ